MDLYVFLATVAISLGMCQPARCSDIIPDINKEGGRSAKNFPSKAIELNSFAFLPCAKRTDAEAYRAYRNALKYVPLGGDMYSGCYHFISFLG